MISTRRLAWRIAWVVVGGLMVILGLIVWMVALLGVAVAGWSR